jgi:hypothetical protein
MDLNQTENKSAQNRSTNSREDTVDISKSTFRSPIIMTRGNMSKNSSEIILRVTINTRWTIDNSDKYPSTKNFQVYKNIIPQLNRCGLSNYLETNARFNVQTDQSLAGVLEGFQNSLEN